MVKYSLDAKIWTGWWFGCHQFYFPTQLGISHHPNWLSHFSEGWPWPTNRCEVPKSSPPTSHHPASWAGPGRLQRPQRPALRARPAARLRRLGGRQRGLELRRAAAALQELRGCALWCGTQVDREAYFLFWGVEETVIFLWSFRGIFDVKICEESAGCSSIFPSIEDRASWILQDDLLGFSYKKITIFHGQRQGPRRPPQASQGPRWSHVRCGWQLHHRAGRTMVQRLCRGGIHRGILPKPGRKYGVFGCLGPSPNPEPNPGELLELFYFCPEKI